MDEMNINQAVCELKNVPGHLLVDVRTPEEYLSGHIPGSINVPLERIADVEEIAPDFETPLFLYCRSGNRSGRAALRLKEAGYLSVANIGGINDWTGPVETGEA